MDVTGWPGPIAALYTTLLSRGFEVVSEQQGAMGGVDVVMSGTISDRSRTVPAFVNINADRGRWMVTAKFAEMSRWITTAAWKARLDDEPMAEQDHAEQTAFIRDRIREMATAVDRDPDIESALIRIGEDFMRRKLGL